jgi:transposase
LQPSPHLQGWDLTVQKHFNAGCWVGIDVSKDQLDIAVLDAEERVQRFRYPRSPEELASLAQRLGAEAPQGIVLEATGGLENRVISALLAASLPVVRVNPQRAREFARARGLLAKTDALDAYALALFGARMQPPVREFPDAERQRLQAWVARVRQLTSQRAMERTRLGQSEQTELRASIQRVIEFVSQELTRLEREMSVWIEQSPSLREQEQWLRTAPGVGAKTARVLLAQLPELGRLNRREIASLAGLAPFACDSGRWRGRRRIRGGRAGVRSALYLAAWTAIRSSQRLRCFYERLVQSGKARQLAMIAVARKLLVGLNQMLASRESWKFLPPEPPVAQ